MIDTIEGRLSAALMPQWFGAWLGGVLGVLAFLLAVTGLYGVVAYAVARRTRELGIRIALGATPHDAIRLVLRQGLTLALIGVGVGLLLAMAAGSLLHSLLYGISPTDPVALGGSALIVISVAAVASWLPARRASRVDPMIALRAE
jgi:ABC-type antimicrobial peptide transport system permease subunit